MKLDREVLLAALSDVAPALQANRPVISELSHFWLDGDYIYAHDGGLGVRRAFESDFDCGLPGRPLLDLLKTSALKEVSIELAKDSAVIQMGKARISLVTLEGDRNPWRFPVRVKQGFEYPYETEDTPELVSTLKLSADTLEAIGRVAFLRAVRKNKQELPKVVEQGVVVIPQKDAIEFYATDSASMARVVLREKAPKGLPQLVLPWAFVDRLLELAEPDSSLLVFADCLIVEGKGVLICSNLLEPLPDEFDVPKALARFLHDKEQVAIPTGIQPLLDRASILAGQEEAYVLFEADGKALSLAGKYQLGTINEKLPLKGAVPAAAAKFKAADVKRGLGRANAFSLSDKSLVMTDGENFLYVLAAYYDVSSVKKAPKKRPRADDEDGDE